jgi:hypothetical protein
MESALFEVAIGLMFIYLVLSLVITAANELIAQIVGLRAHTLANALPGVVDNADLLARVLDHGLINGSAGVSRGKPVAPALEAMGSSYIAPKNFASAVLASLDPAHPVPGLAAVTQAATSLPDSNVRDALLSALAHADGDLGRARDNIAGWFDGVMARLSGVYKRRMQWIGLVLAILLTFGLNVDSIRIGSAIWADTSLRDAVSQAALSVTAPGDGKNVACDAAPKYVDTVIDQSPAERAADCLRQLESTREFPIGWAPARFTAHALKKHVEMFGLTSLFTKIVGLAMTVLAISLGAPFWFDLLSRFVRVRATGKKPAPTAT